MASALASPLVAGLVAGMVAGMVAGLVAGMVWIHDMALLRHGGMGRMHIRGPKSRIPVITPLCLYSALDRVCRICGRTGSQAQVDVSVVATGDWPSALLDNEVPT